MMIVHVLHCIMINEIHLSALYHQQTYLIASPASSANGCVRYWMPHKKLPDRPPEYYWVAAENVQACPGKVKPSIHTHLS